MKESDIRPKELFQKYLELSAADTETYFISFQREHLPCPSCGNESSQPAFEKSGFGYTVCWLCQTLYQNPRPPLEEFSRFVGRVLWLGIGLKSFPLRWRR